MTQDQKIDINQLLGGIGKASTGGLLTEGQHVVTVIDVKPNYRKAEKKDGTKKGWSDPTPEVIVTLGSDEGVTTMWLNPVAFKRMEDISQADINALANDANILKALGITKAQLKPLSFEQQRNLFFEAVVVDDTYNADDNYAVRRDNNCRVMDPARSEKGRQIMDRLAVHAGLCQEGEAYDSILSAKGAEIGIEVASSASGGTKVKRTMLAEDVN